jgi:hypothetical protein
MNGQAGGSTLGNTFGQGTSWVPLGLAALGGGLAGASRAGSPASNMGSGLMSSMLGYYANQAATADERARRMKIEDEGLQRQKDIDAQNRQVQFGNLAIQSGHGVSMQPVPGAIESTIGGQKVWFTPKQDFPIDAFVQMAEAAFPGSGATYRKSMESVPGPQRGALAEPMFKATQMAHGNTQTQNLYNTIGALGRSTPNVTPEMELGMGSPPPMSPPSLTPAQVAMYQQAAQFEGSRPKVFEQIQQNLAELAPGAGPPVDTTPPPGMVRTRTDTWDPAHRRPKVSIVTSPENPAVQVNAQDAAFAKVEAARYEASPDYRKFVDSLDYRGKAAITTSLNKAKAGIPSGITEIQEAMGVKETGSLGPDKQFGEWLAKHPKEAEAYNRGKAEHPDVQRSREREKHYLTKISGLEETLRITQKTHPNYPAIAQQQAENYRNLAEQDPAKWYKEAFSHMAELLGWTRAKAMEESTAFAKRHNLQIQGVQ